MERRLFSNMTDRLAAVVGEECVAHGSSVEKLAVKSCVNVQTIADLEVGTR